MDWFEDFQSYDEESAVSGAGEFQPLYVTSDTLAGAFYNVEDDVWGLGQVNSQLWVSYADIGADVEALFRATVSHTATLSDTGFVHATMAVDAASTFRRYPQLWLGTVPPPVQENIEDGIVVVLETFAAVPSSLFLEFCDHEFWGVNEQCPTYYTPDETDEDPSLLLPAKRTGIGLPVRFDLYLSTTRAYAFFDGRPVVCADLPAGKLNAGETIYMTIGDVLYHSGADEAIWDAPGGTDIYSFFAEYQPTEARRTFDDLGLSSNVAAPPWDESARPCTSTTFSWKIDE
jgi:hypothetical protein